MKSYIGNAKKRIGCAALVLAGMLSACAAPETPPALIAPARVQGESATVVRGDVVRMEAHYASVKARSEDLYFDRALDGCAVWRFECAEGAVVRSGDVIMRLDTTALERELASLETQIAERREAVRQSDAMFEAEVKIAEIRMKIANLEGPGAKENALLEVALEQDKLARRQARASENSEIGKLESRVQEIRTLMQNAVLYAPRDGVVAGLYVQAGDTVSYRTAVAALADMNEVFIQAMDGRALRKNEANRYSTVIGRTEYALAFEETDSQKVPVAGMPTEPLRLVFAEDVPEGLFVGQFVYVYVTEAEAEDVLVVPRNALFESNEGAYVYRMVGDATGEVVKRVVPVQTGVMNDSTAEIVDGLAEGDVVFVK